MPCMPKRGRGHSGSGSSCRSLRRRTRAAAAQQVAVGLGLDQQLPQQQALDLQRSTAQHMGAAPAGRVRQVQQLMAGGRLQHNDPPIPAHTCNEPPIALAASM